MVNVVPSAILKRHCKDIGHRMIKCFPARVRVILLRIVRATANDGMGVMTV